MCDTEEKATNKQTVMPESRSERRAEKMKKVLSLALLCVFATCATFYITVASAQSAEIRSQLEVIYRNISILVDGKKVETAEESFLMVDQGRVMVPVRTISEALGVGIEWEEATNQVKLTSNQPPKPTAHDIGQLTVLRNVGPFYTSNDNSVSIANRQFASGLLVDNSRTDRMEFTVKLDQKYMGFETYLGVEDHTQNSSSNFIVSFYADDRLIDSPSLRITADNPVQPAQFARWLKYDGLSHTKRLTVRVEVISSEDDIGEYSDLIAAFGNFKLFLKD